MPKRDRERLIDKLKQFAADPFARHSFARPMRGQADRVRLRQGDHRAVLLIFRSRETVVVERIGNRREVYR